MFEKRGTYVRATALALMLCLLVGSQAATSQDAGFELAFCVQFGSYPMADRDLGGFDVDIANLLAAELGATPTFTWTRFDDVGIRDTLHTGICDAAIGVGEGVAEMLSTVPYLNASYAFVTRETDGLAIESLDDPQLRELEVGTYQNALPTIALRNRGILDNVTEYAATIRPTGVDPHTPILDAVVSGEVDVGIVYGPYAAARAAAEEVPLELTPLTPEVDFGASLLQLSRILTIGVRPHDEALRDDLNRALAARWDDIGEILDSYGIPRFELSRPLITNELAGAMRVGVIFPASTPAPFPNAPVGDNALRGMNVAESAVPLRQSSEDPFLVLSANAPTIASLERAARRLVQVDGVHALIGGYTPEEARTLATIATELDVPFFNAGSEIDALRSSSCYPTTFHVAPSTSMTVTASLEAAADAQSIYLVAQQGPYVDDIIDYVVEVATKSGVEVAGSAIVEPDQFVYYPLLQEIAQTPADTLLLIMSSDSQEVLMGQAASLLPEATLLGVSPIRGQSRPYLERFRQVLPGNSSDPRVVAWDPAVDSAINTTFSSRTGDPMEPAAWTTYAAIALAYDAASADALGNAAELRTFLHDPANTFDVGKSSAVRFRDDGQMLQELYVIATDPEAGWGRSAAARTALATVTDVVPAEVTAAASLPPATCEAP